MRLLRVGLLCVGLVVVAGCRRLSELRIAPTGEAGVDATADLGGLSAGESTRWVRHEGRERSYLLYAPTNYDPGQAWPVVLVFHGGGGNAENARRMTGFNEVAEGEGFLVVYPNGNGRLEERILTWNAGTCCGYAMEEGVDDVGFVRALLADLAGVANIDPKRVYATGMSNGAMMAYRLACDADDLVAAIGPVAATQNVRVCAPEDPVSVIHFHGSEDKQAPYEGGVGAESITKVDYASVAETVAFWVEQNGCVGEGDMQTTGNVVQEGYAACELGSAVVLYSVLGGGHAWPGGQKGRVGGDEPSDEISASELMWAFFQAHPKP